MNETPTTEEKFCVNCVNVVTNGSGETHKYKCLAEKNKTGKNPVDGSQLYRFSNCYMARGVNALAENAVSHDENCGPEGKWYEYYERPAKDEKRYNNPPVTQKKLTQDMANALLNELDNI